MPLPGGAQLGSLEIIRPLGAGGMGEVYLARDRELNRTVAIKVLPPDVTTDPHRVARFEQEARAASALNHPNVCIIHALGRTDDGRRFIAMEYVDGETLRQRLAGSRLTTTDALDIAIQIAAGLTAAHAVGIVHRDIKPENVMIRRDRIVKVLDFGLAKLTASGTALAAQEPTRTLAVTDPGSLVGTVGYMSPEQARAGEIDGRTDIWALGVVLYEMVAGRPPFSGASRSDVLVAILEREPAPLARFDPAVPGELQRIVSKALRKDPEERYQVVKDLLLDLKAIRGQLGSRESDAASRPASGGSLARHRPLVAAIAVLLAALGGLAVWWLARAEPQPATSVPVPASEVAGNYSHRRLTFGAGLQTDPALSPDGRFIAYASDREGNFDIWVQPVAGDSDAVRVTTSKAQDTQPAWSPDGNTLVFRSERGSGGLFLVPAFGGAERQLTSFGQRPEWSPDGSDVRFIVGLFDMSRETGDQAALHAVPPTGGEPREILREFLHGGGWRWIASHPDGRISALGRHHSRQFGFFTVSSDGQHVVTSTLLPLGEPAAWPARFRWAAGGSELYVEAIANAVRSVWKVRVNPRTLDWLSAERLTTAAGSDVGVTTAANGSRVAFSRQNESIRVWAFPLDASAARLTGAGRPITEADAVAEHPALSPDGRMLAYVLRRSGSDRTELRAVNLDQGTSELLATNARGACWSPDGSGVAYNYVHFDRQPLEFALAYRQLGGTERFLSQRTSNSFFNPTDWTPDGQRLLGTAGSGAVALWPSTNPDATSPERVLLEPPDNGSLWQARYSPDGRWIAFVAQSAAELTKLRLTVAPAEGAPPEAWTRIAADHEWPDKPRWAPDGRTLFFLSRRRGAYFNLWAIRFEPELGRPLGEPFALTAFDSPGSRVSTYIDTNEIGIAPRRAVLPMMTVTGSVWMMEGVGR
jgi:Tol biopolymer transport system component